LTFGGWKGQSVSQSGKEMDSLYSISSKTVFASWDCSFPAKYV